MGRELQTLRQKAGEVPAGKTEYDAGVVYGENEVN